MAFVKLADNYTDLIGKFAVALLAEGVDRNLLTAWRTLSSKKSPSSRRAWIEILWNMNNKTTSKVALLAEGVDRNCESRNTSSGTQHVALLAEGVDRNNHRLYIHCVPPSSPSSGRAWIEILAI